MSGTNFFTPETTTLSNAFTDESGLVVSAECTGTPPTTANMFQHGATIIQTNSGTGVNALYQNVGSSAVPSWSAMGGAVPGSTGTGMLQYAQAKYSFAVDGGAVSTITLAGNATLPANAIILGGTINVTTQLTSGGAATVAIGTSAGSSTTSILGATAVASFTTGQLAMKPVFTAATYQKLSAAGQVTVTIATAALTAGVMDIILVYVVGAA